MLGMLLNVELLPMQYACTKNMKAAHAAGNLVPHAMPA
jgi:hypothetical protein